MSNADTLRQRLDTLGWSQKRLAEWLSEVTGDDVSYWTVQSWLRPETSKSARSCPGWPIVLLDTLPQ